MSKLDVLMKDIVKKYGANTAGYGIVQEEYDKIPFTSPRLNYMSFGGLATGRIYEFSGPEGSGKTTTAMDIMKNAQIKFQKNMKNTKRMEIQIFKKRKYSLLMRKVHLIEYGLKSLVWMWKK